MSDWENKPKRLTPLQAAESIRRFCAYQERCHQDVRNKLYEYGLNSQEVDEIISGLIEENFLNEERFALAYAGGHFRIKKWGRIKIKQGLKAKNLSPYCIKKALDSIDGESYWQTLEKLTEQKWALNARFDDKLKYWKTRQLLLQRGFESDLITEALEIYKKGISKKP